MEIAVWIWLPNQTEPVVAGKVWQGKFEPAFSDGPRLGRDPWLYLYGRSYLENANAISLYEPELPFSEDAIQPVEGLTMHGCIRDGLPDDWGKRVIVRQLEQQTAGLCVENSGEATYLLESNSDRIGTLDFQRSVSEYVPRNLEEATLEQLADVAQIVEEGKVLPSELYLALMHGTSVGGARPKAAVEDGNQKFIAKFSSSLDSHEVIRTEFVAMKLALACGLRVAPVELRSVRGRDALLVEKFDRIKTDGGWYRKSMVSALTILGLSEGKARLASYETLAEKIRLLFAEPKETLRELYGRLCFNILCGNTDDHARNHAAFWDGRYLTLTPAYDICPQPIFRGTPCQGMLITGKRNHSFLVNCLNVASDFLLNEEQALRIMEKQITVIAEKFNAVWEEAELAPPKKNSMPTRQFLNPSCLQGLDERYARIGQRLEEARAEIFGRSC